MKYSWLPWQLATAVFCCFLASLSFISNPYVYVIFMKLDSEVHAGVEINMNVMVASMTSNNWIILVRHRSH